MTSSDGKSKINNSTESISLEEKVNLWIAKGYDTNGNKLSVGDLVEFGEKHVKGKIIGRAKDGRMQVEVIEKCKTRFGIRTWRYIYELPSVQTRLQGTGLPIKSSDRNTPSSLISPRV